MLIVRRIGSTMSPPCLVRLEEMDLVLKSRKGTVLLPGVNGGEDCNAEHAYSLEYLTMRRL